MSAIQELDSKISNWRSSLLESLELSPASISLTPQETFPLLLLIHVMYHQCLCALHSSIVPLFSWSMSTEGFSYARQLSAQVAFEHANTVSSLIGSVLAHSHDVSLIHSFVGYAAYSACVIQIPFMWCSQQDIRERARRYVVDNLKMIRHLGRFWKYIALLVCQAASIKALYCLII